MLVGFDDLGALGLPYTLHDNLLGSLRRDTAEFGWLHGFLDEITNLKIGIELACLTEANLTIFRFELGFILIVRDHLPAPKGLVLSAVAVDGNTHIDIFGMPATCCRSQRRLDGLEDRLPAQALFVGDGLDDLKDFLALVHLCLVPQSN